MCKKPLQGKFLNVNMLPKTAIAIFSELMENKKSATQIVINIGQNIRNITCNRYWTYIFHDDPVFVCLG